MTKDYEILIKRKIENLREFSEEMEGKSKNETSDDYTKGGYMGMSKAYKAAARMLVDMLEKEG